MVRNILDLQINMLIFFQTFLVEEYDNMTMATDPAKQAEARIEM